MAESSEQAKSRLRRACLARRAAMEPRLGREHCQRIAGHVIGLTAWDRLGVLHAYVEAMPGEVATRPLIEAALDRAARVIVPVVSGRTLRHAEIAGLGELAQGRRGLWEPATPRWVELSEVVPDLVLVPGVLFDRRGYRIGHGGGFYDGFLAGLRGVAAAGLTYDEFLVDWIPTSDHDVPVQVIVTESGVHTANKEPSHR